MIDFTDIPIVDLHQFLAGSSQESAAARLRTICKSSGFFYVVNHGVAAELQLQMEQEAEKFFQLSQTEKQEIHMKKGGRAWRGYFFMGEQQTSGKVDLKEGLYLGAELDESHPEVAKRTPLHGKNMFPSSQPSLRPVVLEWLKQMEVLGNNILRAICLSLQLRQDYFQCAFNNQFLSLFRIFHYPAMETPDESLWGVGEHTDYGLITILKVTDVGLEVKNRYNQWVNANPIKNTFIVNIGDMLERMTKGLYKSTPHRVGHVYTRSRYSFPFFYDPGWNVQIRQLQLETNAQENILMEKAALQERWDKLNLSTMTGTYGSYLLLKVSKVFPALAKLRLGGNVMAQDLSESDQLKLYHII